MIKNKELTMKGKMMKIMTIIAIVSLLPIFMGQDDCQYTETIKQLLNTMNKKLPAPPPGQNKLYISHLSFMDAATQSTMANTELAELINEAVIKGMNEAQKANNKLAVDEVGHIIPNTDGNVNRLVNITFAPEATKNEKINQIIADLMIPSSVDVIVTGQYIDDARNPLISVRPLAIVKANQKIITKNLQFTKEELLCQDPTNPNRLILCRNAYDQIAQAVQELLEQL
jgi:hypothetical protein